MQTAITQWQRLTPQKPTPPILDVFMTENLGKLINARLSTLFRAHYIPKNQRRDLYQRCWCEVLKRLRTYHNNKSVKPSTAIYLWVDRVHDRYVKQENKQRLIREQLSAECDHNQHTPPGAA